MSYLRLDGSVEATRRFQVVRAFNADPTVEVLLLTTAVGGLGLNLTAADVVIFLEHDWNPQRDLQARERTPPPPPFPLRTRRMLHANLTCAGVARRAGCVKGSREGGGGDGCGGGPRRRWTARTVWARRAA